MRYTMYLLKFVPDSLYNIVMACMSFKDRISNIVISEDFLQIV